MTIEMQSRPSGKQSLSERLVERLSELGPRHSRRSFFTRAAVAGSALAVNPLQYVLKPGTAYAQTTCGPGATCGEGWSVFCCTINNGANACPPGSFVAGWWKADNSSYCGGGPRYIIDCNQSCDTPCTCYCPTGTCDNRRSCCNQFRYGQCHQEIACAGPVRCRMVMCIPPWQFDASCTTSSATDNRTGEHNAPCNDQAPPPPVAPPGEPILAGNATWIIANKDGRLESVTAGPDGAVWTRYQRSPGAPITGSARLGGNFQPGPNLIMARNGDGRLEIFGLTPNGNVAHMWQTAPGNGWSGMNNLGGWITKPPAVGHNSDGRLVVFAVALNNQLYHRYQMTPNGNWSDWVYLGGVTCASPPAVARNADGRMELFVIGADGALWHKWQLSYNGAWSGWSSLGGSYQPLRPAVRPHPDGRLHVVCVATDKTVRHQWQTAPNAGWTDPVSLGGSTSQPSALGLNADGRHEIFIVSTAGELQHAWEHSVLGPWAAFETLGTGLARLPAVCNNVDGRMDVIVIGADTALWGVAQVAQNGAWTPLFTTGGSVP